MTYLIFFLQKCISSSVRTAHVLGLLQLNFESLGAHLESVHGLDGSLSRQRVVKGDEAKALAEAGCPVDEHLGADDCPECGEHLEKVRVIHVIG